jgi:hypothetical protein
MPKRAKSAVKSKTIWGGVIALAGAALPIVQAELAASPPNATTRLIGLGLGILGAALVAQGRSGEPAPVRGLFTSKGH